MSRDYKVKPRAMHYVCMIELLGREGFLDEAFALIRDAPFRPTINKWAALLTACRVHKNFELGKFAAEKLYGMEPEKLINYVMLLNIYNSACKQDEAAAVVQTLKRKGLGIKSACTWIEIKKLPHVFLSGDKCHVQTKEMYEKVDELMLEISKYGYVTEGETLLPDVDEQEQKWPHYHSEKLAISFGLISTSSSTPLQLVQSHRVCNDCHNAIKLIAMITKREIVVRDASRFHRFKNHTCSCGDYWRLSSNLHVNRTFRALFYMEPETSDGGSVTSGVAPNRGAVGRSTRAPGAGAAVRPLPALKEYVKRVMFYC